MPEHAPPPAPDDTGAGTRDVPERRCACVPTGNLAPLPECAVADAHAAVDAIPDEDLERLGARFVIDRALKAAAPHIRTIERRHVKCRDVTSGCTCQPYDPMSENVCDYRLLADTIASALNPPGDDTAEVAILGSAVERIAAYVRSLICTCSREAATYDDDPCLRCQAIGQRCGKTEQR